MNDHALCMCPCPDVAAGECCAIGVAGCEFLVGRAVRRPPLRSSVPPGIRYLRRQSSLPQPFVVRPPAHRSKRRSVRTSVSSVRTFVRSARTARAARSSSVPVVAPLFAAGDQVGTTGAHRGAAWSVGCPAGGAPHQGGAAVRGGGVPRFSEGGCRVFPLRCRHPRGSPRRPPVGRGSTRLLG